MKYYSIRVVVKDMPHSITKGYFIMNSLYTVLNKTGNKLSVSVYEKLYLGS